MAMASPGGGGRGRNPNPQNCSVPTSELVGHPLLNPISIDDPILPGLHFKPTDAQLINFYLRRQIQNQPPLIKGIFNPINLFGYHPRHLAANFPKIGRYWYFFASRTKRVPTESTSVGYWVATTNKPPAKIEVDGEVIGHRRTLTYYEGKNPGKKTRWLMCEYTIMPSQGEDNIRPPIPHPDVDNPKDAKANDKNLQPDKPKDLLFEDCALCKIYESERYNYNSLIPLLPKEHDMEYGYGETDSYEADVLIDDNGDMAQDLQLSRPL